VVVPAPAEQQVLLSRGVAPTTHRDMTRALVDFRFRASCSQEEQLLCAHLVTFLTFLTVSTAGLFMQPAAPPPILFHNGPSMSIDPFSLAVLLWPRLVGLQRTEASA
jgi:hypothetical protein